MADEGETSLLATPAGRLGGFAAVLVLALSVGLLVGSLVGPVEQPPAGITGGTGTSVPAHGHP
jgi:hypothetical protein